MTTQLPEPAFPTMESNGCNSGAPGMTMRDYFAAKAMNGMLSDMPKSLFGLNWMEKTAFSSYQMADAMLAERAK